VGVGAFTGAESMMPPVLRTLWLPTAAIATALALGACGTEGIQLSEGDPGYDGAVLFAERCSGCHTLKAAGAQGSANREVRNQGPNLDQRIETVEDALYAIRNGGFSGAIMPQNIVVGHEAEAIAAFVAEYAGSEADRPEQPGDATENQSEAEQAAAAGE
jgi:mono/diheme cytochrome c family protein